MNAEREAWAREVLGEDVADPKWQVVEQHFGCVVPSELKEFYVDLENLLSTPFRFSSEEGGTEFVVDRFCPIGEDSIHEFEGYEQYLPLADDGAAGYYLIDPTAPDPAVSLMYIDDSEIEFTGLRLGRFLALAKSNRTKNEAQQVEAPDAE